MAESLEQVLADARGDAAVLRRQRQGAVADALEALVEKVAAAAEDYLTWLSEPKAALRSGHREAYWRAHFAELERAGNAKRGARRGERLYRQLIVPQRADVEGAYAAGLRGERAS